MIKRLFSCIVLIALPFSVLSENNDFQIWSSFSLQKKIDKKTNLFFKQGLRYREDASERYKFFSDFKIRYKYNKRWGSL